MKILIVTDAWRPQTNGVVSTLSHTVECLRGFGHEVCLITPIGFRTVACPSYPEIRLAIFPGAESREPSTRLRPMPCISPRRAPWAWPRAGYCLRHGLYFTTSYHTQFPQYLRSRLPIPLSMSYRRLRAAFTARHGPAWSAPQSMQAELEQCGLPQCHALAARR